MIGTSAIKELTTVYEKYLDRRMLKKLMRQAGILIRRYTVLSIHGKILFPSDNLHISVSASVLLNFLMK